MFLKLQKKSIQTALNRSEIEHSNSTKLSKICRRPLTFTKIISSKASEPNLTKRGHNHYKGFYFKSVCLITPQPNNIADILSIILKTASNSTK